LAGTTEKLDYQAQELSAIIGSQDDKATGLPVCKLANNNSMKPMNDKLTYDKLTYDKLTHDNTYMLESNLP
jgi:hypothetical protein